jgi:hypothetical protein
MLLELGAGLGGNRVVDEVVEKSEKLSAGHFSFPDSPVLALAGDFFWRK